ncbi:TonB family protein [Halodurantibacterium flavum]|uniref:TonB family protein n=1 Tax=Halodurantibacterium flavum TaxID=1382802 RepID=A0ABW4RZN9_9RHOB
MTRRLILGATALAVSGALHGVGLAISVPPPATVQIDGGAQGVEAALGDAFEDFAQGTLPQEQPAEPAVTAPLTAPVTPPVTPAPMPDVTAVQPQTLTQTQPQAPVQPVAPAETSRQAADPAPAPEMLAALSPELQSRPVTPVTPVAPAAQAPLLTPVAPADPLQAEAPDPEPQVPVEPEPQLAEEPPEPPEPAPEEAPEEVEIAEEPPEPTAAPETSARPEARPETRPEPQRQPEPTRTAQPQPAQPVGNATVDARRGSSAGQEGAPDAAQGQVAGQASEAGNAAASNYPGEVLRKITRLRRPSTSGRGTVLVAFSVSGSGALAQLSVVQSSGSDALDRAALDHIQRAAPFPPPPPGAQTSFSFEFVGRS